MQKVKKQFRLFDVYRYLATGYMSTIQGLPEYHASIGYDNNKNYGELYITVEFINHTSKYMWCNIHDEDKLKEFIYQVNKRLSNCRKPGKKVKNVHNNI